MAVMKHWLPVVLVFSVAAFGSPVFGHDPATQILIHVGGEGCGTYDLEFGINETITVAFAIGSMTFNKQADVRGITVMRRGKDGKEHVISVNVRGELEGRVSHALILQDGDMIHVPAKRKFRKRKPESSR